MHAGAHFVQYRFKIREGSPERARKTIEERICAKSGVKGRRSDRWWKVPITCEDCAGAWCVIFIASPAVVESGSLKTVFVLR